MLNIKNTMLAVAAVACVALVLSPFGLASYGLGVVMEEAGLTGNPAAFWQGFLQMVF